MQLEFHQLERRWEHLRVRHTARQRRLLASLAESGQQTPIVVVAEGQADRYVVIDDGGAEKWGHFGREKGASDVVTLWPAVGATGPDVNRRCLQVEWFSADFAFSAR